MTGAKKSNSTSTAKRELIALPNWLPPSVEKQARRIEGQDLSTEQRAILLRLATDDRMRKVWKELSKRKRPDGGFVYAAKSRQKVPSRKQNEAQNEALAELFHFAFCAARDRISVSKAVEVEREKEALLQKAKILRELAKFVEVTAFSKEHVIPDPLSHQLTIFDAGALLRVAHFLEHVAAAMRPPSDPLMVQYHRGDPVVKGVQIEIAAQMQKTFGRVLHGTAATIASVALAKETTEKVTRTAFSDQNPSKKGSLPKAIKKR